MRHWPSAMAGSGRNRTGKFGPSQVVPCGESLQHDARSPASSLRMRSASAKSPPSWPPRALRSAPGWPPRHQSPAAGLKGTRGSPCNKPSTPASARAGPPRERVRLHSPPVRTAPPGHRRVEVVVHRGLETGALRDGTSRWRSAPRHVERGVQRRARCARRQVRTSLKFSGLR